MIGDNVIEKTDKIVQMVLLSPHEADHLFKKEDGTFYWCHHRRGFGDPQDVVDWFHNERSDDWRQRD